MREVQVLKCERIYDLSSTLQLFHESYVRTFFKPQGNFPTLQKTTQEVKCTRCYPRLS